MVITLARGFADRDFAVDLVAANAKGEFASQVPSGVRIVDLKARRVLTSLPGLVQYLQQARPIGIIAAMDHSSIVAIWARKLAGVGTRVIATTHTHLSQVLKNASALKARVMPFLIRHTYPFADAIVAVSNGVADDLATLTRLPRRMVKVIYNPALTPELLTKAKEPVHHPWFAPGRPPVILGVGRLTFEKDFSTLIRAFAQVRQQRVASLLILGEGEKRPCLEALSRELGVRKDVSLPGYEENPYAYMARAGVFVLSSIYEGFPLVLLEALATGAPVVSTDCESGPREALQHGRYGTLVSTGNVEALAKAILCKLDENRKPAPSDWLHNFEVSAAVDAYLELILPENRW